MDLRLDHIALRCNDIEAVKTFGSLNESVGKTSQIAWMKLN